MQSEWRGTSNFWRGRVDPNNPGAGPQRVAAIVDHIMVGTLETTDGWFRNSASQVSAHYGVGKDGRVWQWVKTDDSAWANGIPNNPDLSVAWLDDALNVRHVNPNCLTVSIEHEGDSGDVMPPAQYAATLELHRYLVATFGVPVDADHIIGHCRIDSVNRAHCPGTGFNFARLLADLAQENKVIVPPPPPSVRFFPETGHSVGHGFLDMWETRGGLPIFGFPLTEEVNENGLTVQWFERARMEYSPATGVGLGLVGKELLALRAAQKAG